MAITSVESQKPQNSVTDGTGSTGQTHDGEQGHWSFDPRSGDVQRTHEGEQAGGDTREALLANATFASTAAERTAMLSAITKTYGKDTSLPDVGLHDRDGHRIDERRDGKELELERKGANGQPEGSAEIGPKGEKYTDPKGDSMELKSDGKLQVKTNGTDLTVTPSEVDQKVNGIDVRYQRHHGGDGQDPQPDTIESKVGTDGKTKIAAHTHDGTTVEAGQDGQYTVNDGKTKTHYQFVNGHWTSNGQAVEQKPDSNGDIQLGHDTVLKADGTVETQVHDSTGTAHTVHLKAETDKATASIKDPANPSTIKAEGTATTTTTTNPGGTETATEVQTAPQKGQPAVLSVSGTAAEVQTKLAEAQQGQPVQLSPGDFALGSNNNAQMGPAGQGGDFQLATNPNNGGYSSLGSNFWGNSFDANGNFIGISTDSMNYQGSGCGSGCGSAVQYTGGDNTVAASANALGSDPGSSDVVTDVQAGSAAMQVAIGDVASLDPQAALAAATMAVGDYEAAKNDLAGKRTLSPQVAEKVEAIIAWINSREDAAKAVETAALQRQAHLDKDPTQVSAA